MRLKRMWNLSHKMFPMNFIFFCIFDNLYFAFVFPLNGDISIISFLSPQNALSICYFPPTLNLFSFNNFSPGILLSISVMHVTLTHNLVRKSRECEIFQLKTRNWYLQNDLKFSSYKYVWMSASVCSKNNYWYFCVCVFGVISVGNGPVQMGSQSNKNRSRRRRRRRRNVDKVKFVTLNVSLRNFGLLFIGHTHTHSNDFQLNAATFPKRWIELRYSTKFEMWFTKEEEKNLVNLFFFCSLSIRSFLLVF